MKACFAVPSKLPADDFEFRCDALLATVCVDIAGERHCGKIRIVLGPMGEMAIQEGKDFSGVRCVIGTGGPLVFARDPAAILGKIFSDRALPMCSGQGRPYCGSTAATCFTLWGCFQRVSPKTL